MTEYKYRGNSRSSRSVCRDHANVCLNLLEVTSLPWMIPYTSSSRKPMYDSTKWRSPYPVLQEDGLKKAVECFHSHLPLEDPQGKLLQTWELTKPHFSNIFTETSRGMTGLLSEPVRGFRDGGT